MEEIRKYFVHEISDAVKKMVADTVSELENNDERRYIAVGDLQGIINFLRWNIGLHETVFFNGKKYELRELHIGLYSSYFFILSQNTNTNIFYVESIVKYNENKKK